MKTKLLALPFLIQVASAVPFFLVEDWPGEDLVALIFALSFTACYLCVPAIAHRSLKWGYFAQIGPLVVIVGLALLGDGISINLSH